MSTHAEVLFVDGDKKATVLVAVYHHWDGYPSGVGVGLADFLKKDGSYEMGGLAAQYIAAVAGFGVRIASPEGEGVAHYTYVVENGPWDISTARQQWQIKVYRSENPMFEGSVGEFTEFCEDSYRKGY